jgi:hypothetical protein
VLGRREAPIGAGRPGDHNREDALMLPGYDPQGRSNRDRPDNQTQHERDFRVKHVPSWDESRFASQSACQFAVPEYEPGLPIGRRLASLPAAIATSTFLAHCGPEFLSRLRRYRLTIQ